MLSFLKIAQRLPSRSGHTLASRSYVSVNLSKTPVDINPKQAGNIMDVFASANPGKDEPLPPRFSEIKKAICKEPDAIVQSWRSVIGELQAVAGEIEQKGSDIIPSISYSDVSRGLTSKQVDAVRRIGAVVVRGAVPQEEALSWKQSIIEYIEKNNDKVTGGPAERIVFYEIYNSQAQIQARTHPSLIATQKFLLSLWHTSDAGVPLDVPMSYFDRLRIRPPGPSAFTLGPHIDGGSVERWEDPGFRACFAKIFEGGESWRTHDPFDASPRFHAYQDLYHAPNQCSVFRPWQGWTSLSNTSAGEGTLRVLPSLHVATAYIMLRPFFRPRAETLQLSLDPDDWVLDLENTAFPGSALGKTQELNERTHPHLQLDKTMVSISRVGPGDQVYWHCDLVHAVESEHNGQGDSSVLYIPAVPLTARNAHYLRRQAETFRRGLPPPDFPGGVGESNFAGRIGENHVGTSEKRQMLGLDLL